MLTFIQIEFCQSQSRESGQNYREELQKSDLTTTYLIEHQGRQDSETDFVCQGIEFLADPGRCLQQSGREAVKEITYGSAQHQDKTDVRPSVHSENHPHDPAKEIHGGDCVGNVLPDVHLFDSELLLHVLGESILVDDDVDGLAGDKVLRAIIDTLVVSALTP